MFITYDEAAQAAIDLANSGKCVSAVTVITINDVNTGIVTGYAILFAERNTGRVRRIENEDELSNYVTAR